MLHDDAYLVAAPPADGVVAERRVAPPRSTQLPEVRTMSNSLPFPVPPAAYTLRVRAVDTDHEVPVRGAVLMSGHRPSVMLVDQLTPFELSAPGPMVSGILQTIDEDDDAGLHVELLRHGGRDRHDRVVMAASQRTSSWSGTSSGRVSSTARCAAEMAGWVIEESSASAEPRATRRG